MLVCEDAFFSDYFFVATVAVDLFVSGVCFRSYRCQIKSFIFNGFALGDWGARKHRKNPLK